MRTMLMLAVVVLAACPSTPVVDAGAPVAWDEAEDRAMRNFLAAHLRMSPEVVARLKRLDTRLHCGEYVDEVRRMGFIVGREGDGFRLDAVGSPPKASVKCQTYDDFIQTQGKQTGP